MRRTHRRAAALVIGTITLAAITGCAHTTADDTPEPTPAQTSATSTPATTSPTIGQAPDGTPIPGGKPTWLTNLPDPSTVDRTDPEAVIRAYVATAATWDTTVDKTSAYATQRAAIYLTDALRQAAADYDPDTAMVELCDAALDGDEAARARCARAIVETAIESGIRTPHVLTVA